jgi:hypothetical protein
MAIEDPEERADFDAWLCKLRHLLTKISEIECPVIERFIRQQNSRLKEMWEAGHDPWEVYADLGKPLGERRHDFIKKSKSGSACDHCGTPAKRRYAVRIKGRPGISMVGSSCAKRFPRARTSDLIRSLGKRTKSTKQAKRTDGRAHGRYLAEILGAGYTAMPPRMSPSEFISEFGQWTVNPNDPNKRIKVDPLAKIRGKIYELYKWKGLGVIVSHSALDPTIDPSVRIAIYDPYSGTTKDSLLGYVRGPLGEVVSQTLAKDRRVQEWLDTFPKWDPIAEHVKPLLAMKKGSFDFGPGDEDEDQRPKPQTPEPLPLMDFRILLKRTYPNYFTNIYLGSYGLSIQAGHGIMSEPNVTYKDPYDYESFEVAVWKVPLGSVAFLIHPSKIPGFPPDLLDLWSLGESVAGYVSIDNVQRIYDYLAFLAAAKKP